jgi:hypothetical protein
LNARAGREATREQVAATFNVPVHSVQVVPACDICCQPLDKRDTLVGLGCTDPPTHVFHRECIQHWRANPRAPTARLCPVCHVDPVVAVQFRRHTDQVRAAVAKDRSAWCLPKRWGQYAREVRPFLIVCFALFVLAWLTSAIWDAWTDVQFKIEMLHAPKSRDQELL